MKRLTKGFWILVLLVISTGCSMLPFNTASDTKVSFRITIDPSVFSVERPVRFVFWSAEQLEIAQRNANCSVSYNAETETEEVHCPEGVTYQAVTPVEFSFALDEISNRVELTPGNIYVKEHYRLQISGLSSDNCNSTSASVEEIAKTEEIVIEDLMWMTTMMACPEMPG
jgi:hypothetical protein